MATQRVKVIDLPCPKCNAGEGVPCAKVGYLIAHVDGGHFHPERWEAATNMPEASDTNPAS